MECTNPYESPRAPAAVEVGNVAPVYGSRIQAVRGEMWRGAKFGFKICFAVFGTILVIEIVAFVGLVLAWTPRSQLGQAIGKLVSWEYLGQLCLAILGIPIASLVLGALPGSLIKGTAAAIAWRPIMQHTTNGMSPEGSS